MQPDQPPSGGAPPALTILAMTAALAATGCFGDSTDSSDRGTGDSGTPVEGERAYLERLGTDTLAVEIVRRSPGRIEGEVLARSPVTRFVTYAIDYDESGIVTRFETEHVTPAQNPAGPARWHATMVFDGETATIVRSPNAEVVDTVTVAIDAFAIPSMGRVPMALGTLELALERLEASGLPGAVEFQLLTPWSTTPTPTPTLLTPRGASEFEIDFFGSPMVASIDAGHRVSGVSGAQTTVKIEVEPIESPDIPALAAAWAAQDFEGVGLGAPSPPGSVEESGGGANFVVTYSRPAMRGRAIWGTLVPFGEVWRTGANGATHLTTDRNLTVGDLEIVAGTYTLWSVITEDEAMLIVNAQTRIWGTAYDGSQDVGRTAMTREDIDDPVERFTITIEPNDTGGTLAIAWGRVRYSVPLTVR